MASEKRMDGGKHSLELVENLSRTKLELFLDCERCFYFDRRLSVPRIDEYAYTLNLAVDALLKKEFDSYRNVCEPHPLMLQRGIDAVPLFHPSLADWREASKGIRILHEESGFIVHGAVDDIWKERNGDIAVVDYKCASRLPQDGNSVRPSYRRQIEVYQWILRKMGYRVSSNAYFVFAVPDRSRHAFQDTLHFSSSIVRLSGNDSWVEDAVVAARKCLELPKPPAPSARCPWCAFAHGRTFEESSQSSEKME